MSHLQERYFLFLIKILISIVIFPILQMRKLRLREINQREEGRKEGRKGGREGINKSRIQTF